ncbi:MAG: phospholipase D-like domain-containing protein [Ramlibacter sp.]
MTFGIGHWATLHTAVVLMAVLVYSAVSIATRQRRHPSAAIGWVLSLVLVPYIALPVFLLFGTRKMVRVQPLVQGRLRAPAPGRGLTDGARFQALARGLGLPPPVPYGDLHVHEDGAVALARLELLIRGARSTLEVSTFLLGHDAVGDRLALLLAQRAREGVRVRLMIDGVGRYLGGRVPLHRLRAAGVELRLFVRPWSSPLRGRVNLRNHRKMAVADAERLWVGGRNLAADYFSGSHGRQPWTDLSFDLRGPLAAQALRQFEDDWALAVNEPRPGLPVPVSPEPVPGGPAAQLLPSGPDQPEDTLYELLIDACFSARERIVAVTPYFVPDPALLMAFTLAARRGVVVDLVVPSRSNHLLADLARPAALRDLAEAGARVWLAPRMVHAKLVIVDAMVAVTGSLNLDQRSLFLNYELMVAFYDADAIGRHAHWAEQLRAGAQRLQPRRVGVLREVGEGLLRWLTFQL